MKEIVLASDHAGYELKAEIKDYLNKNYQDYKIYDVGCQCSNKSVDYPVVGLEAAVEVVAHNSLGIVICGTGIGISIAANKIKGARCALVHTPILARLAKEHNDANMIALGGRFIKIEAVKPIIAEFLKAKFQGGRHQKRTNILDKFGQTPCTGSCC